MSLTDWIITIPSYKRHDIIMEKTLSTLQRYRIPPSKITIFVADNEEKKLYEEAIPKGTVEDIVVGVLGIDKVRNFILDYYPKGKHIVMIDDDLRGLNQKSGTNSVKPIDSLIRLIERGFRIATAEKCSLWGIYPVNNAYFMRDTITTDLRFIPSGFFGVINPKAYKDPNGIAVPMPAKEDCARTIMAYERDGKDIRFNYISIETEVYSKSGGLQVGDRLKREKASVEYLLKKYPDIVSIKENTS
jgi:hypothetical protein